MKNTQATYKHKTNIPRNKNLTDYSFLLRKSKLEKRKKYKSTNLSEQTPNYSKQSPTYVYL